MHFAQYAHHRPCRLLLREPTTAAHTANTNPMVTKGIADFKNSSTIIILLILFYTPFSPTPVAKNHTPRHFFLQKTYTMPPNAPYFLAISGSYTIENHKLFWYICTYQPYRQVNINSITINFNGNH